MADMIFMSYSPKITNPNWGQDLYMYRFKSKVPIIYYLQLDGEDLQTYLFVSKNVGCAQK
jgi:hypothetical protein